MARAASEGMIVLRLRAGQTSKWAGDRTRVGRGPGRKCIAAVRDVTVVTGPGPSKLFY
jgi:hypothetical protein